MTGRGIIVYVTEPLKADEVTINAEFQENIFIEIKLKGKKPSLLDASTEVAVVQRKIMRNY